MMDFDRHYISDKKKKGASITTLAYVNPNGKNFFHLVLPFFQNMKAVKSKPRSGK